MKYLLILSVLFFISCDNKTTAYVPVCNCQQQEKVAAMIQNSIRNANNYSDEEMEDVIEQLEKTYIRTICSRAMGIYNGHAFDYKSVKQDSCLIYYPYLHL